MGNGGGFSNTYSATFFGNDLYTGNWMQMSDARMKTDIHPAEDGLANILKLKPTYYQYLDNTPYHFSPGEHAGLIAQDVVKVMPQLVSDIVLANRC
jgi:hypothetical protein